jgi:hypothetical protein
MESEPIMPRRVFHPKVVERMRELFPTHTQEVLEARLRMSWALRDYRKHFLQTLGRGLQYRREILGIRQILHGVFGDCRNLDRGLPEGSESLYLACYPVFHDAASFNALHQVFLHRFNSDTERGRQWIEEANQEDADQRKKLVDAHMLVNLIRGHLRDQWPVENVLSICEKQIAREASQGNEVFFIFLGKLLALHKKTPLTRSFRDWIARAWLPLGLWECPADGVEACERMTQAANLLGIPELMPQYPQFKIAWANARASLFKPVKRATAEQ